MGFLNYGQKSALVVLGFHNTIRVQKELLTPDHCIKKMKRLLFSSSLSYFIWKLNGIFIFDPRALLEGAFGEEE